MATPKEHRQLHELRKYHDPKCDGYEECELQYINVAVMNDDGVVDEVPASELPPHDESKDPWWIRALRWLTG